MQTEEFTKYLRNPSLLNSGTLEDVRTVAFDFPWFQTAWMLYLKNLKNIASPDYDTVLKKVAVMIPDRKQLYKFLNDEIRFKSVLSNTGENMVAYELVETNEEVPGESLIDLFLKTNPTGIKRKIPEMETTKQPDNKDLIDRSVSVSDDLITETLAKIYVQQKNYEKALEAYQKLSLKYPEKSIYFASRIKEIEVLKHNT